MHPRAVSGSMFLTTRLVLVCAMGIALAACGGGSGGGGPAPQAPKTGLVIGAASGPIYDELSTVYQLTTGTGSESPDGYGLLIYDGESLTPEEIETLPSTDAFLNSGKILIVLNPTLDDFRALEGELGAAALVDVPAVAVFKTFYGTQGLQAATVVEFPTTIDETLLPIEDSSGAPAADTAAGAATAAVQPDDATIRAQTEQWRKRYERIRLDTWRSMSALKNVPSAQLAGAATDDGGGASSPDALGSSAGSDLDELADSALEQ